MIKGYARVWVYLEVEDDGVTDQKDQLHNKLMELMPSDDNFEFDEVFLTKYVDIQDWNPDAKSVTN